MITKISWNDTLDGKPLPETKSPTRAQRLPHLCLRLAQEAKEMQTLLPGRSGQSLIGFVSLLLGFLMCLLSPMLAHAQSIPSTLGWYQVPNTSLHPLCPPDGYGGSGYAFFTYCPGVTTAWNSGVMDTKRNRLIVWGGGHNDYAGNEVYAIDLNSLTSSRLTNPGCRRITAALVLCGCW